MLRTVRLAEHLAPERSFDISGANFRLGCLLDDVLPHFRTGQWLLPRTFPADIDLHPAAEVFRVLSAQPIPDSPQANWERLEVLTDGSFDGGFSIWGFLVLGWTAVRVHVVGWAAGCVIVDEDSPLFVGASTHDAIKALAWLAQGPKGIPVHPWSDCVVALQQANGLCGMQDQDRLAYNTRAASPFSGRSSL